MRKSGFASRAGGMLLLAFVGTQALAQAAPRAAAAAGEARLQSIGRKIDRLERECRRLQDGALGEDPSRAEVARPALEELRGLSARLEQWLARRDQDPYRRNLERFLRDLESRLTRLDARVSDLGPGDAVPTPSTLAGASEKTPQPAAALPPGEAVETIGGPLNDQCAAAPIIGNRSVSGSTIGATNDGESACGGDMPGPDVWFRYWANEPGFVFFDTFGSSFDTVLSLHTGCPATSPTELACSDDALGLQSEVRHYLDEGEEVVVRLAGFGDATGSYVLNVGRAAEMSGAVVDAVTGEAIEQALVQVYDGKGNFVDVTWTNGDGEFELDKLRPGTYFAKASHYKHLDQLFDGIPCPGYCDPLTGTPIELAAGDDARVDFALRPGATIEGRVNDEVTGAPIAEVIVAVYNDSGYWQGNDATSISGEYSIGRLLPGTYFAVAEGGQGYLGELFDGIDCSPGCDPVLGTPLVVAEDATTRADFTLRLGGSITGRVTDAATGRPLERAFVTVVDESGWSVDGVRTDPLGQFASIGLADGSYFVVAGDYDYLEQLYDSLPCPPGCDPTAGTPVAVALGAATTGIDFALVRDSAFTGILRDAAVGVPVAYAWVDAWNDQGAWFGSGSSDMAGVYTVGHLGAGDYFATTANDAGYLDELYDDLPCAFGVCDPVSGTPISLLPAMTTGGIDFALDFGGSISGRVTDASGSTGLHGRVQVWDSGGNPVDSSWTDDGTFRVLGLTTGDHFVATDIFASYHDELYDDILCIGSCSSPAGGTPVPVTAGVETGGIDFALCGRPNLQLHLPPHPDPDSFIDGCHVQIDGLATRNHPGCPGVDSVQWHWGDYVIEMAGLPASHVYAPGTETVPIYAVAFDTAGLPSVGDSGEIRLWDCLPPGACGEPHERVVSDVTLDSDHLIQACTIISLGPGLDIVPPADVTFRAGAAVVLGDGLRIVGERVAFETDPGLLP